MARAINETLGNAGATVTYGASIEAAPSDNAASLTDLVRAMDAGQVEALVILGGVNPVYTAPADLKFSEKLSKVSVTFYHGLYTDETAYLCHWNIPDTHPLESWGDSRSYDGTVTLTQPLIAPLYEGRCASEVLAAFTSQPDRRGAAILKDYWTRAFAGGPWTIRASDGQPFKNFDAFWRRALHDGFINGTSIADGGPATPFVAEPRAASPAGAAAAAAGGSAAAPAATAPTATPPTPPPPQPLPTPPAPASRSAGRTRVDLPPGSDRVGWAVREQRLAAGTAETADQTHVGRDRLDQPAARSRTQPGRRRRHRTQIPRQHGADADLPRARPPRTVGHGLFRIRPPHGGQRGERDQGYRIVQRVPAAHLRRALVRQRPRDRQDRRTISVGDDAGTSPDGRARAVCGWQRSSNTRTSQRSSRRCEKRSPRPSRCTRITSTRATSGAWRSI